MRSILLVAMLMCTPFAVAEEPKADDAAVGLHPRVKVQTTLGDFVLELNGEKAPISVKNFMAYVQSGFYNETIFHRVKSDFMIQGGGRTADMSEKHEGVRLPIRNEWQNGLKNERGTIAMARMGGNPNSATCEFFINVKEGGNPFLDRPQRDGAAYAVFGKVVEGMDVVDKIRNVEVHEHPMLPMGKVAPVEPVIINTMILLNEYDADKVTKELARQDAERQAAEAAAAAEETELGYLFQNLAESGEDPDGRKVVKTESGLMYLVLKEGSGASPNPADEVEVHYTGWLMTGKEFDSSVKRGSPARFPLNRVIKGWTEGVGLMKVGAKYRFLIPYELAYGERGRPPRIPAKSMLVFDVELLSIKAAEPAPEKVEIKPVEKNGEPGE